MALVSNFSIHIDAQTKRTPRHSKANYPEKVKRELEAQKLKLA